MSHWRSASGSAFGPWWRPRRCWLSVLASDLVSESRPAFSTASRSAGVRAPASGTLPMMELWATPSTPACVATVGREARVGRTHRRDTDLGVLLHDLATGGSDRRACGVGRAVVVDDDVFSLPLGTGLLVLGRRCGSDGCRNGEREDGCEREQESPHEFPLRAWNGTSTFPGGASALYPSKAGNPTFDRFGAPDPSGAMPVGCKIVTFCRRPRVRRVLERKPSCGNQAPSPRLGSDRSPCAIASSRPRPSRVARRVASSPTN